MFVDLKKQAINNLTGEGYPPELADMLDYTDKARMEASLQSAKQTFLKDLMKAVAEQL